MKYYGQFGGRVIRPFKGNGTQFIKGAILKPEVTEDWPVANCKALANSGHVEWFSELPEDEKTVRSKKKIVEEVEEVEEVPKVKASRRTTPKKTNSKRKG